MKATIIIPTAGNRIPYLKDVLESAQIQDFPANEYEILVVDNSRNERVAEVVNTVNRNGGHIVCYIKEEKSGANEARHTGARLSQGEVLVYIDDDVILPNTWLDAVLGPFMDPKVGCSGGKVLPRWEAEVPLWFSQFNQSYLSLLDYGETKKELKVSAIWSCNMAVRKDALFEVGGFNVDFFTDQSLIWLSGDAECGLEDKLLDAGYKIIYEPRAWVYHRIPASRLTPEYFFNRLIFTGIHQSYTRIRKWRKKRFFFARLLAFAILDFLKSGYRYVLSLFNQTRKIWLRADSLRLCYRARHAFLTILSKRLREHVLRESYL